MLRMSTQRATRCVSFLMLASAVLLACVSASFQSISLPTYHLDGAFQTASSLYRLQAGQLPGRDFFPYLGLGPVFTLWPFFTFGGGDLAGSVFASRFAVALVAGFTFALTARLLWWRWPLAIAVASVFIILLLNYNGQLPYFLLERIEPGNSLRPIRALVPYLAGLGALWIWQRHWRATHQALALGMLAGACTTWSNDYGFATAATLIVISLIHFKQAYAAWKMPSLLLLPAVALGMGVTLTLLTGGHALDLLRYNFQDVARDQWWYFGDWSEASRLFNWQDAALLLSWKLAGSFAILTGVTIAALRTRRAEWLALCIIGGSLFAGGLIPQLGIVAENYFAAFYFWALAVGLLFPFIFLSRLPHFFRVSVVPWLLTALCSFLLWFIIDPAVTVFWKMRLYMPYDQTQLYVPSLGGYLPRVWKSYLEQMETGDAPFEEYWGIASAFRRSISHAPVDSVIHALGRKRAAFETVLRAGPKRVTTTRKEIGPDWQSWTFSANWWFYRPLLLGYDIIAQSPTTLVWKKRAAPRVWPRVSCRIEGSNFKVNGEAGLYDIQLFYRIAFPDLRLLVMVQNHLNWGLGGVGFLSLDPHAGDARFPLAIEKNGSAIPVSLRPAKTRSQLQLMGCRAEKVGFEPSDLLPTFIPSPL